MTVIDGEWQTPTMRHAGSRKLKEKQKYKYKVNLNGSTSRMKPHSKRVLLPHPKKVIASWGTRTPAEVIVSHVCGFMSRSLPSTCTIQWKGRILTPRPRTPLNWKVLILIHQPNSNYIYYIFFNSVVQKLWRVLTMEFMVSSQDYFCFWRITVETVALTLWLTTPRSNLGI